MVERADALAWAESARAVREEVIAALEAGHADLATVLERAASEELVGMIHVLPIVEALPSWGKVVCRRTLDDLGVDHRTPLREVDPAVLLDAFGTVPS